MADKQLFLIALDVLNPVLDLAAVKQLFKSGAAFDGWRTHLPGVFPVMSDRTADGITDRIRPIAGEASFLVPQANPAESEGLLPKPSWDWIRRRAPSRSASQREAA